MFDSKTEYFITVLCLGVTLLVGCAASEPEAPQPEPEVAVVAKPEPEVAVVAKPEPRVEVAVVAKPEPEVAYVEPSVPKNKERPDWIFNEPNEEDNQVSFVGVSKYHATERGARKYARRNAINVAVQYLGSIAKIKFEELSISFGLSSKIVDDTDSAQEFRKFLSANMVRRLKTKKWHMEQKLIDGEVGIQYYVLAVVTKSAIENSFKKTMDKSINKLQREAENAATEKAKKQVNQALEMFRKAKKEGLMD